jgi:hypothetical protein
MAMLLVVALPGIPLSAEVRRDQYFAPFNGWGKAYSLRDIAQSFHVTLDGFLDSIDLHVNRQEGVLGTMYWDIRPVINGFPSESNTAILAGGSIPVPDLPLYRNASPIKLDVSGERIRVRPGDQLAIVVRSTELGTLWLYGAETPNHGTKYERSLWTPSPWELQDIAPELPRAFSTYVRLIPEPGGIALLSLGLASLGFVRRKNQCL